MFFIRKAGPLIVAMLAMKLVLFVSDDCHVAIVESLESLEISLSRLLDEAFRYRAEYSEAVEAAVALGTSVAFFRYVRSIVVTVVSKFAAALGSFSFAGVAGSMVPASWGAKEAVALLADRPETDRPGFKFC